MTDSIEIHMSGYPTCNPMWQGSCVNTATCKELVSAHLQFDFDTPYTGDVHETLTRPDVWDSVGVNMLEPATEAEQRVLIRILEEAQAQDVQMVLAKAWQFYPQLLCRNEAEELAASGRGYEAFIKIMAEVPRQTPWSVEGRIGSTDANGRFAWRPIAIAEEWNMPIGYIILREGIRRHLKGATKDAPPPPPSTRAPM